MTNFEIAQTFTAKWEGGYSDDEFDAGGATKYGVSFAFLSDLSKSQRNRDTLERMGIPLPITVATIKSLSYDQAQALFRWQFWLPLHCNDFPLRVAVVLYDAAVNCGLRMGVKFVQRGCNAAGWTPPLVDDGLIGPKSTDAFLHAEQPAMIDAAIDARDAYYHAIVRNKPTQQKFLRGWLNRTKDLRKYVWSL